MKAVCPLVLVTLAAAALLTLGCGGNGPARDPGAAKNNPCVAIRTLSADLTQCRSVMEPYVRYDDPDAVVFNDLPIELYFFSQTPPEQTEILKPVQIRAVVSSKQGTCRDAGIDGLVRLQRLARRQGVNAVVNIRSTWNNEQLGDDIYFGCTVTRGRYALIWEGALAKTPVPAGDGAEETAADAGQAGIDAADRGADDLEVKTKLRKLEELYYQGLISRKEYLERRKGILDAL